MQSQAQATPEQLKSADATTARILQRLEVTQDIANLTLEELDAQNAKIKATQDDLAEVHDDLDISSRKLAGTKSFWGVAWGKKKHDQRHVKDRAEYEKDLAKQAMKDEKHRMQDEERAYDAQSQTRMAQMQNALNDPTLHRDLRAAEKQGRAQQKAQAKAQAQTQANPFDDGEDGLDEPFNWSSGEFHFEERTDGMGEQVQAEKDLDTIHSHVQNLKGKAWTMGERVDESSKRLENVQAEVDRADARTNKNIKRGDKIINS